MTATTIMLTDEQIDDLWIHRPSIHDGQLMPQLRDFARAILARQPAAIDRQAVALDPEQHGLPPYPKGSVVGPCVCGSWPGGECLKCRVIPAAPLVEQDERRAFESWAASKGRRFNEGDLQNAKSWALAAWMARAEAQQAEPSTGICFFCGEPINGEHESDCPQAARAASTSANVAQGWRLVPERITDAMIESAMEAHYGKRRVRAHGGATGIAMTVNEKDYNGYDAMRRFWKGALADDARECLMDVVSHHHDFRTACIEIKAANETTRSDELYWQKQIDVLDRMKGQAERALTAAQSVSGDTK